MANPFLELFAAFRQNDVQNLDNMTQSMLTPNQAYPTQPQQSPPMQGPQLPPVQMWDQSYDTGGPTSVVDRIYSRLMENGVPEHVAQAFLFNTQDESGFQLGIQEHDPKPGTRGGRGLLQWTGPRRDAYEAFAKARGVEPYSDTDSQVDFFVAEANGPERSAFQTMLDAPTAREAAAAMVSNFLRPAKEHEKSRTAKYLDPNYNPDFMSGMNMEVPDVDYSAMDEASEEGMEDMSPEAQKNRRIGMMFSALGQGLGQISKGDEVDLSSIIGDYQDRQSDMRDRILQMQQERVRRSERKQGLQLEIAGREDEQAARANESAMDRQARLGEVEALQTARREETLEEREYQQSLIDTEVNRAAAARKNTVDMLSRNPEFAPVAELMASDPTLDAKTAWEMTKPKDLPASVQAPLEVMKLLPEMSPVDQEKFLDIYGKGGQQITFDMGDKEEIKYDISQMTALDAVVEDKEKAIRIYSDLEALDQMHPDGKIPTGFLQNVTLETRSFLESMNALSPEGELTLGLQQAMNMATRPLVSTVREPGATSNLELPQYIKSNPNISASPFANDIMKQARYNDALYYRERKQAMREYFDTHDRSLSGWEKHLTNLEDSGELPYNIYNTDDLDILERALVKGYLNAGDIVVGPNRTPIVLDEQFMADLGLNE